MLRLNRPRLRTLREKSERGMGDGGTPMKCRHIKTNGCEVHPLSHFAVNSLSIGVNASCASVRNGAAGSPAPFTRFAPCG